jgi:hypothetical protein
LIACGGGGDTSNESTDPRPNISQTSNWERFSVAVLEGDAALTPNVVARVDDQGLVHIFYYEEGEMYDPGENEQPQVRYQIQHATWDPETTELTDDIDTVELDAPNLPATGDSGLNNSLLLDAAFTNDGTPVVAYQGGDIPQSDGGLICNMTAQADLMVNFLENEAWYEYTGIEGDASPKNPLFTDGYVGISGAFAIDSQNNLHMAAQHYYEFCDWTSTHYPDLLYVQQAPGDLGHYSVSMEENVDDFNIFGSGGGVQSDMGHHAKLVLNQDEQPLIFYVGTPSPSGVGGAVRSLRMAIRDGALWTPEIIQTLEEWDIGFLSAAVAPDGTVGVAYFMENISDNDTIPDHLRYAQRQTDGSWRITEVDATSHCGDYCSLTFDSNNRPGIAYYDIHANTGSYRKRENLKFARYNGSTWNLQTVSTSGVIGQYNTLWFDADDTAYISTYEFNDQQIVIFRELSE